MEDPTMTEVTSLSQLEQNPINGTVASSSVSFLQPLNQLIKTNNSKVRSLLKAVSYRLLGTFGTISITYIITHEMTLSLSIGAFELLGKIILFYVHERIWDKLS